jgi:hypothetical protein
LISTPACGISQLSVCHRERILLLLLLFVLLLPLMWFVLVQIMQCISETFGRHIWRNTLLLLTHGNLTMPPPGTTFGTSDGIHTPRDTPDSPPSTLFTLFISAPPPSHQSVVVGSAGVLMPTRAPTCRFVLHNTHWRQPAPPYCSSSSSSIHSRPNPPPPPSSSSSIHSRRHHPLQQQQQQYPKQTPDP